MSRMCPVVRGASLSIDRGEIVAILGPNGAGKSTLIKAVAGLVPVFGGRVHLSERDITGRKTHELIRQGLAFVPQTENVFTALSVAENLALASAVLPPRHSAASAWRRCTASFPIWRGRRRCRRAGSPAASGRCSPSPARCW